MHFHMNWPHQRHQLGGMLALCGLLLVLNSPDALAQPREDKVRADRKKYESEGYWIYNDLPKAWATAKAEGKPLVVVLRCVPCEECVKIDDELMDADPDLRKMLDQFVRVRVVGTNGLDLGMFQFDTDQSFALFLFNPDGTLYGRYGTRSHRTDWEEDVSVKGMIAALEGALELHKAYPAARAQLAAKRGPTPAFERPEQMPGLREKYKATLDYAGKVVPSCIHCHQIGDASRDLTLKREGTLPITELFPFPHPKTIGLILDPTTRATVLEVKPNTPAAQAELQAGDQLKTLAGQPLLSMADVQWVLNQTPPTGGELPVVLQRGPNTVQTTIRLADDWRRAEDISWRVSTWNLRRFTLGGILSVELTEELRQKANIPAGKMGLLVQHVGQYAPHNRAQLAGVRKGDIILACDEQDDLMRETDLIAYILEAKKPGDAVSLRLQRDGKPLTIRISLPKS